jgi:hypothetical protein
LAFTDEQQSLSCVTSDPLQVPVPPQLGLLVVVRLLVRVPQPAPAPSVLPQLLLPDHPHAAFSLEQQVLQSSSDVAVVSQVPVPPQLAAVVVVLVLRHAPQPAPAPSVCVHEGLPHPHTTSCLRQQPLSCVISIPLQVPVPPQVGLVV